MPSPASFNLFSSLNTVSFPQLSFFRFWTYEFCFCPLWQDHTKLILCPLMAAVTYIDEKRDFRTYKLSLLEEFGCSKELASRLRYAKLMVEKLLDR